MGRTRKDAQQQAAENALRSLAGMANFFKLSKIVFVILFCSNEDKINGT